MTMDYERALTKWDQRIWGCGDPMIPSTMSLREALSYKGSLDLARVRRVAAGAILKYGHAQGTLDEQKPGKLTASVAVIKTAQSLGERPGLAADCVLRAVTAQIALERGYREFPYGLTLHHFNDHHDEAAVVAALRGLGDGS